MVTQLPQLPCSWIWLNLGVEVGVYNIPSVALRQCLYFLLPAGMSMWVLELEQLPWAMKQKACFRSGSTMRKAGPQTQLNCHVFWHLFVSCWNSLSNTRSKHLLRTMVQLSDRENKCVVCKEDTIELIKLSVFRGTRVRFYLCDQKRLLHPGRMGYITRTVKKLLKFI